jgi:REP element-mobilizing transposase RayT
MATCRGIVVDREHAGFYHCVSRCVRRAFLCGGEYEHRRRWIQDRLRALAGLFAIDVCGYAVMNNHVHVVLWTNPDQASRWTRTEVAQRWLRLFPRAAGTEEHDGAAWARLTSQLAADGERIETIRRRLCDLSWFMRCLCEPIARWSNREDGCTGRFWEGRFKCQRLLDEAAVLACVVYVDLNVIRARLAPSPEASDYTSVQDRIRVWRARGRMVRRRDGRLQHEGGWRAFRDGEDGVWLAPIRAQAGQSRRSGERRGLFNFGVDAYLKLVDTMGRLIRSDKRGAIPAGLQPILERLSIDGGRWIEAMRGMQRLVGSAVGSARALAAEAVRRGTTRVVGALNVYALDEVPGSSACA